MPKELEKLYSRKQVALFVFGQKMQDSCDKIEQIVGFIEKLVQSASTKDILMFQASLESKMSQLILGLPQLDFNVIRTFYYEVKERKSWFSNCIWFCSVFFKRPKERM